MRAGALPVARAEAASGLSPASSAQAATARAAASISAICVGNMSRNRPEMRQVTSTRGRADARHRQHFDAGDAAGGGVPLRAAAHQRQALGDLLAAGAQAGAAPQVDHQRARPVAVILKIAAQHIIGGGLAEVEGGRRRHGARIGGEQVAAGRQHVGAAARRRARRPGADVAAVECRQQRDALRLRAGAAHFVRLVFRGAAIDMQPVLDREILEVAKPGVDAAQRLVRRVGPGNAGLRGKAVFRGRLDNQRRQTVAAAAVEAVGLRIFVDQPFELLLVLVQTGGDGRRRQMAERDRGDAALGLRGLAGIADDEGIDDRQCAGDDLGEAVLAQRHGLARQPFQRAMRADMDQRMAAEALPQPQAEGDERVARRQRRIVIVGAAVGGTAAIRRERDGDIAEGAPRETGKAERLGTLAACHAGRVAPLARFLAPLGERWRAKQAGEGVTSTLR